MGSRHVSLLRSTIRLASFLLSTSQRQHFYHCLSRPLNLCSQLTTRPLVSVVASCYSNNNNSNSTRVATDGEKQIESALRTAFPGTRSVTVEDVSGGCGQMYQVRIVADEFRGARTLAQHRMVKAALAKFIPDMHGLSIDTEAPPAADGAPSK
uniref:BolA-like protein 3 n=2 Tax=Macrostomum lignano TaxID=282301 RepID=A0A1I8J168_9PLAT